jgi:hypothetical protein
MCGAPLPFDPVAPPPIEPFIRSTPTTGTAYFGFRSQVSVAGKRSNIAGVTSQFIR